MKGTSDLLAIRAALPEDSDELYGLSQVFVEAGALRHRPRVVFQERAEEFLTVDDHGRIVGCVAVHRLEDIPSEAVLYNFCVASAYHRQGLGQLLVDAAVERMERRGVKLLYTATTRADGWFGKHAFRRVEYAEAPSTWVAELDPFRKSLVYVRELSGDQQTEPHKTLMREGRSR